MDAASQRYGELLLVSNDAFLRGENRLGTDKALEAILAAPSKWDSPLRFYTFHCYLSTLVNHEETNLVITSEDRRNLVNIYKDETEPTLFRANAILILGQLYAPDIRKVDKAADCNRRVLDLVTRASPMERDQEVVFFHKDNDEWRVESEAAGAKLDRAAHWAKEFLHEVGNPKAPEGTPLVNGRPDPEIMKRVAVGGGKCDCCGKKREDNEGGLLARCVRCKKSYYCSPVCQQKQWEEGHKKACRAPDQIVIGDYMRVHGLTSKPELNGMLARVVKRARGGERWEVSIAGYGCSSTFSLAADKLIHLRPSK